MVFASSPVKINLSPTAQTGAPTVGACSDTNEVGAPVGAGSTVSAPNRWQLLDGGLQRAGDGDAAAAQQRHRQCERHGAAARRRGSHGTPRRVWHGGVGVDDGLVGLSSMSALKARRCAKLGAFIGWVLILSTFKYSTR